MPDRSLILSIIGEIKAEVLAKCLDLANGNILEFNRVPARKLGELDNRGSHFYLALYWAQELAKQNEDSDLKSKFEPIAKYLSENEKRIVAELAGAQGKPVDIGGYYLPDQTKLKAVMFITNLSALFDSAKSTSNSN